MLKTFIRAACGAAATGALLLGTATMASAAYEDVVPNLTSNDSSPNVGQQVTYVASEFLGGTPVTFTLLSTPVVLGVVNANSAGTATLTATMPNIELGAHHVEATGLGKSGTLRTVSINLTLSKAGSSVLGATTNAGGGNLAFAKTGSSKTSEYAATGAALVVLGAGAVAIAKRRRDADVVA